MLHRIIDVAPSAPHNCLVGLPIRKALQHFQDREERLLHQTYGRKAAAPVRFRDEPLTAVACSFHPLWLSW